MFPDDLVSCVIVTRDNWTFNLNVWALYLQFPVGGKENLKEGNWIRIEYSSLQLQTQFNPSFDSPWFEDIKYEGFLREIVVRNSVTMIGLMETNGISSKQISEG